MRYSKQFKDSVKKIPYSMVFYSFLRRLYMIVMGGFSYFSFLRSFILFRRLSVDNRFSVKFSNQYPCLLDNISETSFDPHYIYHPAWAARVLSKTQPERHIDISSTLHFCSIVSAFIPVEFYDYRPARLNLDNLTSKKADLTRLHFADNSINSLSCMHTVEHIGLGRYGDALDPDGDLKAMAELRRVLAVNGNLLLVVPVGRPRIMFNAHRIYSFEQIIECFEGLELKSFSLVTDRGEYIEDADRDNLDSQEYACGCFWFKK